MDLGSLTNKVPDQLTKYLEGLDFPAEKQDVIKQAESNQADTRVITVLEKLPPGVYSSISQVAEKAGL